MAIEKVRKHFEKYGISKRIQEFDASSATVELAAKALHCEPNRIAKTLSFKLKNENKVILIVVAGDAKIDNRKYKVMFREKAVMLSSNEVVEYIGHAVGGVCPFGVNDDVEIYLDKSLKRFNIVFPACGSSNSAIGLSIDELEKYTNYHSWIDVCKNWYTE